MKVVCQCCSIELSSESNDLVFEPWFRLQSVFEMHATMWNAIPILKRFLRCVSVLLTYLIAALTWNGDEALATCGNHLHQTNTIVLGDEVDHHVSPSESRHPSNRPDCRPGPELPWPIPRSRLPA